MEIKDHSARKKEKRLEQTFVTSFLKSDEAIKELFIYLFNEIERGKSIIISIPDPSDG